MSSLLTRRLAPSSAAIPPAAEIKSGRFWAGSGQLVRHFDRRRSSSAGPAADPAGGEMHQRQNGSKGSRRGTRPGTAVTGATSAPLCVRVGWSGATTEGVDCQEKGKKGLLCPFADFFEKSPPGESAVADTEPPPSASPNRPSPNQHFGDRFRPGKERRG